MANERTTPAISARGVRMNWKQIASVASILFTLGGAIGTALYTRAEERADERAMHRETTLRLARIEDDVERMDNRLGAYGIRIGTQDTRMADMRSDVDENEREIERLKRTLSRTH